MPPLHNLLRSTAGFSVDFICRALARACCPRIPPHNSRNIITGVPRPSRFSPSLQLPRIILERDDEPPHVEKQEPMTFEREAHGGVQGYLERPRGLSYFDALSYDSIQGSDGDPESTLCAPDPHFLEFSIYSDVSSPSLNKALLITPTRPRTTTYSATDADFTLLREASERVTEILRENRRRLDSGEDTNASRKEARRKRAHELANARKERDLADSLFWRS